MERKIYGLLSLVSLALCLIFSIAHFLGAIQASRFKLGFLLASIAWFVFATLWVTRPKNSTKT